MPGLAEEITAYIGNTERLTKEQVETDVRSVTSAAQNTDSRLRACLIRRPAGDLYVFY